MNAQLAPSKIHGPVVFSFVHQLMITATGMHNFTLFFQTTRLATTADKLVKEAKFTTGNSALNGEKCKLLYSTVVRKGESTS